MIYEVPWSTCQGRDDFFRLNPQPTPILPSCYATAGTMGVNVPYIISYDTGNNTGAVAWRAPDGSGHVGPLLGAWSHADFTEMATITSVGIA